MRPRAQSTRSIKHRWFACHGKFVFFVCVCVCVLRFACFALLPLAKSYFCIRKARHGGWLLLIALRLRRRSYASLIPARLSVPTAQTRSDSVSASPPYKWNWGRDFDSWRSPLSFMLASRSGRLDQWNWGMALSAPGYQPPTQTCEAFVLIIVTLACTCVGIIDVRAAMGAGIAFFLWRRDALAQKLFAACRENWLWLKILALGLRRF